MHRFIAIFLFYATLSSCEAKAWSDAEETPEFWLNLAKAELEVALERQSQNLNVARNVIIFLGDGMSVPTITAGRILKGQLHGKSGEETVLAMDQFHHLGLSKTYSVDKQVSDSACTATAYLCGVKANYQTIGLSGAARLKNCSSSKGNEVDSVLVDAFKAGKSTGIVTTTRINHASPAGAYAHTASRTWYGDADLTEEAKQNGCKDIAQQFYDSSHMIMVALGGGRRYFRPSTEKDEEYDSQYQRTDGQDLIAQWEEAHTMNDLNAKYVWKAEDFKKIDPATTDRLLGLFEPSDMQYEADREGDKAGEPSLAEMTEKAIQMLRKNEKGFFLFVEGGRIDHGHHATNAYTALHDFVAFDNAIEKAVEMTSDSDTLIVITADHSHTFNFGGYADRGNDIFGIAISGGSPYMGTDGKPFTSLLYGNGEGFQGKNTGKPSEEPHSRENITTIDTDARNYQQQTGVPLSSETHGGDDVAIMARGPMSHLFHGVHQQSYIPYVMRYASCTGSNLDHCKGNRGSASLPDVSSTASFLGMGLDATDVEVALNVQFTLLICLFVACLFLTFLLVRKSKNNKLMQPTAEKSFDNSL